MDALDVLRLGIKPAGDLLREHGISMPASAQVFLVAVAAQETAFATRRQYAGGPARGWWQFERGGLQGLWSHRLIAGLLDELCDRLAVEATTQAVLDAIEHNDVLAACVARLLMATDSGPLPGGPEEAWACYRRLWRPGRPRPEKWPQSWRIGVDTLSGNAWVAPPDLHMPNHDEPMS
jgi:hypothetical protein